MAADNLLIKDARMILPDRIVDGDLLVEDGRIARIDASISSPRGAREIDASGLHLLPGVIDPHVHFREPGLTHKETIQTGSVAAVNGGVTSFLEMPNTRPATIDQASIDQKRAIAAEQSYANYGFLIGATTGNIDVLSRVERAAGIKIFVGSSTGDLLVDDQETLERIFAETSLIIAAHCEEESLIRKNAARFQGDRDPATHSRVRSPEAAARSVARVADLAVRHQHRTHLLHLSSRSELDAIPESPVVTIEVCVPHLFIDERDYEHLENRAKVNPAVRSPEDRQMMWDALRAGRFDVVATDHAPHTIEEKRRPYPDAPSGIPSIENSLALMLDAHNRGELELLDLVRAMCAGPADVWGIRDKGRLQEGYDADLVLCDLSLEQTINNDKQWTRAGWSPWDGKTLKGWPVMTFVGGRCVVDRGELVAEASGRALNFGGDETD